VGPRLEMVGLLSSVGDSMAFFWASRCSLWLLSVLCAEVDDARDDTRRGSFAKRLYLTAMPSHVGVDVDGLAHPLHQPTICSGQVWGQGLLSGAVLSCLCSRQRWLSADVKLPGHRYLVESCSL
jgi:hypothetical protein